MENADGKKGGRIHWVRGVVVGCLVLIAFAVGLLMQHNANQEAYMNSLPPGVIIDGVLYRISGWDVAAADLPDGFTSGGMVAVTTDTGEYVSDCRYYVNSAIPEWVYVYSQVWDAHGNSSMAYIRFVWPDIRYNTFIRCDDQIYVQLFNYTDDGEDYEAFYRYKSDLEERYGYRIETETPANCTLVGSAHLEEADRIPQTKLGTNHPSYDGADVYADPEDSYMLYVETSWHTATAAESKETLHTGYDVFVLYAPGAAY